MDKEIICQSDGTEVTFYLDYFGCVMKVEGEHFAMDDVRKRLSYFSKEQLLDMLVRVLQAGSGRA